LDLADAYFEGDEPVQFLELTRRVHSLHAAFKIADQASEKRMLR